MSEHNDQPRFRTIVADDQPFVIQGIEQMLSAARSIDLQPHIVDADRLMDALRDSGCELLILDPAIAGGPSITPKSLALIRKIRIHHPAVHMIVLTAETSPELLHNVVELGVTGVVSKRDPIDALSDAIAQALEQRCFLGPTIRDQIYCATHWRDDPKAVALKLSKREREVLADYSAGLAVVEIAARQGKSIKTISAQKCTAMRKLAIHTDVDLFKWWTAVGSRIESEADAVDQS